MPFFAIKFVYLTAFRKLKDSLFYANTMRFRIVLFSRQPDRILPINYQYPFASAIYKIIAQADAEYASFLHQQGYRKELSLKNYKLFTFSDISTPFQIQGDRLIMKSQEASFIICFHIPDAATHFVQGLFMNREIDIADKKSKVSFTVKEIEVLNLWPQPMAPDDWQEVILKPLSPLIVGITNERGNYDFLSPTDGRFIPMLTHHWKEKYRVVYGDTAAEQDFDNIEIEVLSPENTRSRLITIKAHSPEATQIRGFTGFQLKVKAPMQVLELALNSGIAIYGSMGMGCVGIDK